MNKRNATIIGLVVFLMGSVCADNPYLIRKDLQEKYAKDLLNECQLIEDGLTFVEVLDRDIAIMEEHKKALHWIIGVEKNKFGRAIGSFFKTVTAFVSGSLCVGSSIFVASGTPWVVERWNGKGNWPMKIKDCVVNTGVWLDVIGDSEVYKHLQTKRGEVIKNNPFFREIALTLPVMGAIAVVSGLVFTKMVISLCRQDIVLNRFVAKMKKRIERDNAIIAKLKELKYSLAQR